MVDTTESTLSSDKGRKKTLFIRNLPLYTTNNELEALFGDVGPMKRCFVVKEKDKTTCRGFGYVTYSLSNDAETAITTIKSFKGRKLEVIYADKKIKKRPAVKEQQVDERDKDANVEQVTHKLRCVEEKKDKGKQFILEVSCESGLNESIFSDVNGITKTEISENSAILQFNDKDLAFTANKTLVKRKHKGKLLKVKFRKALSPGEFRKTRLIVRNLSFKCNVEQLKNAFEVFGYLTDVSIPTKPDGKKLGFGFVQFISAKGAKNAVEAMNGKSILGRAVAVDWALAKNRYEQLRASDPVIDNDDDEDNDDDSDDDDDDDENVKDNKKKTLSECSEDKDEDNNSVEDSGLETSSTKDSSEEEDGDENEGSGNDDGDDEDDDDDDKKPTAKKPKLEEKSDVDEGKTIFIRNVSFDTSNEHLTEVFTEFGDVEYGRMVIDPVTDHPRGTAFVKFRTKEAVEKCLAEASEESQNGMIVDGRKLLVTIAVSRAALQVKKKRVVEDKRNLYLAREGMVREGTLAAKDISPADMAKRKKIEAVKRAKLKNINIFVSTTRLCVHNIPKKVTDMELKKLFIKAGGPKAFLTECRIMRDLNKLNAEGVGQSMGFGFVDFKEHGNSMNALKKMNNNPEIFGENKKLIVEFSLENKMALQAKERRLEKSRFNLASSEMKKQTKPISNQVKPNATDGKTKIKKGMPSHMGPKIRHNRPQPVKVFDKPKGKKSRSQVRQQVATNINKHQGAANKEKPSPKKKSKGKGKLRHQVTDNFDKLVNIYRKQLDLTSKANIAKRAKWFD